MRRSGEDVLQCVSIQLCYSVIKNLVGIEFPSFPGAPGRFWKIELATRHQ